MSFLCSELSFAIIFCKGHVFRGIYFFRRQVIDFYVTIFPLILDLNKLGRRFDCLDVIINFLIGPVASVSLVDINSSWLYLSSVSIFTSLPVVITSGLRLHLLDICANSPFYCFGIVCDTTCPALNSYLGNLGPSSFQCFLVRSKKLVGWNLKSKIFLTM